MQEQDKAGESSPNADNTVETRGVGSLDDVRIAGSKTVGDWKKFKKMLESGNPQILWEEAFYDYFLSRLASRYLEPIGLLQKYGTLEGEGFSITAIHCSLIEFLQSTIEGRNYRYVRKGDPPLNAAEEYGQGQSGQICVKFLTERAPFNRAFNEQSADDFFKNVRCGLLHEARTNGGWRILAKSPNGDLISAIDKIIYRDNFHWGLLEFIEWYKEKLLSACPTQEARNAQEGIREAFIRKFDGLCK